MLSRNQETGNLLEPAGDATTAACGLEEEVDGESGVVGEEGRKVSMPAAAAGETTDTYLLLPSRSQ